jgi:pimeloyl-ACP methyl ester carboxylesterase
MSGVVLDPAWRPAAGGKTTIVFVHGAVVNGWEMVFLRRRMQRLGYAVRQFHYHSMLAGLEENARLLGRFIAETKGEVVHVVWHSMGGILTRHVFEQAPDPRPGRLVALGSPFLDCWTAHRVIALHRRGYSLLGRTAHDHVREPRDPVWRGGRDFGVIAGTYPFGIGCIFPGLPKPSDGVVLWHETRLQGVKAHVTYRLNHFGLLGSRRCFRQVARFLATGAFSGEDGGKFIDEPTPAQELAGAVEDVPVVEA